MTHSHVYFTVYVYGVPGWYGTLVYKDKGSKFTGTAKSVGNFPKFSVEIKN